MNVYVKQEDLFFIFNGTTLAGYVHATQLVVRVGAQCTLTLTVTCTLVTVNTTLKLVTSN